MKSFSKILILGLLCLGAAGYFITYHTSLFRPNCTISVAYVIAHDPSLASNPSSIDFTKKSITSLRGIDQLFPSTEILRLSRNMIASDAIKDGTFAPLRNLKTLFLDHNTITYLKPEMFQGLENLEKLYLNNNQISMLEPGVFKNLKNLKKLFLSGNQLQEIPLGAFDGLDHLEKLYIYGNQLPGSWQAFLEKHFPGKDLFIGW